MEGIKAGYAENSGHGGNTSIHSYPQKDKLIQIAEEYLANQPRVDLGNGMFTDLDLEFHVDLLVDKAINEKELRKQSSRLGKLQLKNIVIVDQKEYGAFISGTGRSLAMQTYTYKVPISSLPIETLKNEVAKIKSTLKAGQIIINKGPAFDSI